MKPIPFFLCSFSILLTARAEPPEKSGDSRPAVLSLNAVTESVLANNPAIQEARAKWEALKQRVPQAAAWDDLKISGSTRLGRFVDVARNSFTDQMCSVEQMIPIAGRNQRRARIAAAEARAAYFRLAKDVALLEAPVGADRHIFSAPEEPSKRKSI